MASRLICLALLAIAGTAFGYKNGAPVEACNDMTPQHGTTAQDGDSFPYTVSVNNNEIKAGDQVKITISGKPFMGFLLQVRDGNNAVGSFNIPDNHEKAKTLKCDDNEKSSATHKKETSVQDLTLEWTSPSDKGKTYTVFATVAENGGTYWVKRPTETIKVN